MTRGEFRRVSYWGFYPVHGPELITNNIDVQLTGYPGGKPARMQ